MNGIPIAAPVARALATIGLSAVFFQDPFGLVTFDAGFAHFGGIRPRTGKNHVVHCLDAYQCQHGLQEVPRTGSISATLSGYSEKPALMPVISDFLFDDPESVLKELALVKAMHDVFIVLIDSAFAFEVPAVSAGWIDTVDVETGQTRTFSRTASQRGWPSEARLAGLRPAHGERGRPRRRRHRADQAKSDVALSEFVSERRLRKTFS